MTKHKQDYFMKNNQTLLYYIFCVICTVNGYLLRLKINFPSVMLKNLTLAVQKVQVCIILFGTLQKSQCTSSFRYRSG